MTKGEEELDVPLHTDAAHRKESEAVKSDEISLGGGR